MTLSAVHSMTRFSQGLPSPGASVRRLRFSGDVDLPVGLPPELQDTADAFRNALEQAERLPGADQLTGSPFAQLVAELIKGSGSFSDKLRQTLADLTQGPNFQKSCQLEEYKNDKSQSRMGYRVQSGALNRLFEKRVIHSASSISFEELLASKFKNDKLILSVTGWTKPPVEPFLNHSRHQKRMANMTPAQQAKYVESVYVDVIKDYLKRVIEGLEEELGDDFDPIRDLGILYGVTPEGVDRAVHEFCEARSLPILGVSCYDWAEYIPDEANQPDVFLGEDLGEFGTLMSSANRIILTGGRAIAAGIKITGDKITGADARIPVDILASFEGVQIPAAVVDADNLTSKIVNGAKLAQKLELDPFDQIVVQAATHGRKIDNKDVFATVHILKHDLEQLYRERRLAT